MTVDAVVIQSGHILLVERRGMPGQDYGHCLVALLTLKRRYLTPVFVSYVRRHG